MAVRKRMDKKDRVNALGVERKVEASNNLYTEPLAKKSIEPLEEALPRPLEPEPKKIACVIAANVDAATKCAHHYIGGARHGEVDESRLVGCMDSLKSGLIQFVGMYHDGRRKEFYKHLSKHYKDLGMTPPEIL